MSNHERARSPEEGKGAIYLGGGGDEAQSAAIDAAVFNNENYAEGKINCLFIPVALMPKKYASAEEWFRSSYGGYCNRIDLCVELSDIGQKELSRYNLIYVGGGDTGRLVSQFEQSGFESLIPGFIESGGFVFGGSAGAIMLGKSILTAPEVKATAARTTGLDCIGGWSVYAHYSGRETAEIQELARSLNSNIVAIPERDGAIYDGKLTPVGKGVESFYAQ